MNKFTTLLISCSLLLAGAATAQQPGAGASPAPAAAAPEKQQGGGKKRGGQAAETAPADATKSDARAAKREAREAKQPAAANAPAPKQQGQGAANAPGQQRGGKGKTPATDAKVATTPTPAATASPSASVAPTVSATATPATAATASASPMAAATATAAPSVAAGAQPQTAGTVKNKPDRQKVQEIKARVANFRAEPRPQQVPAVSFQPNYRIQGAHTWQGPQYEVYRSYQPQMHDRAYYDSRYQRVELIGGGYYYYNNGYWAPAWGYSPQQQYYAYDAPIYVGQRTEPPDRIIASVQHTLQEMGLYRGEVDGLLGPLTREALTAYQSQQGLVATAVIDQPTLESLGI